MNPMSYVGGDGEYQRDPSLIEGLLVAAAFWAVGWALFKLVDLFFEARQKAKQRRAVRSLMDVPPLRMDIVEDRETRKAYAAFMRSRRGS